MKPVKLLSAWHGPLPPYYGRFKAQMDRFGTFDWEFVTPEGTREAQDAWLRKLATDRLQAPCRKGGPGMEPDAMCDLRPFYGLLFPERYEGYEWWGWIDLDMVFGDVDRLLPPLLEGSHDVVTFKPDYLSGNFSVLRNTPEVRGMPLCSPDWREVLANPRYCGFDEAPHLPNYQGDSFKRLLEREGVKILTRTDLYGYDSPSESNGFSRDGKRVLATSPHWEGWSEVLFFHCMSDRWPDERGVP